MTEMFQWPKCLS